MLLSRPETKAFHGNRRENPAEFDSSELHRFQQRTVVWFVVNPAAIFGAAACGDSCSCMHALTTTGTKCKNQNKACCLV